jgi:2-keto-3-deoxy-L-rhamnonate aldolase RhmA
MIRTIKQRLAEGELVRTFALGRLVHPLVVEMFALADDYHGFWIDEEHVSHTSEQLTAAVLAGRANEMDSFVRIAPTGYSLVTQCLETGAGGVMAAQIHDAAQAAEFVSWAKFAPDGVRGLNTSGRDADYTYVPAAEFVESANQNVFIAIQVETAGAVEHADEIAALDGVDHMFVGPSDLSMALGVVGQFHHEKLWEAIEHVAAACEKNGISWGAVTPDAEFARRAIDAGCRLPTMGNDIIAIRRGIDTIKSTFGDIFE